MSTANWDLSQLKRQLSERKDIKGWIIQQEHIRRRERYFMMDADALVVDQDRDVQTHALWARIFVHLPLAGRQGEILKKLFAHLPLEPQIESAIQAASQTDLQAWELPTALPSARHDLKTTDPRIAEDINQAMNILTGRISEIVAKKSSTTFNSAELFLSIHDRQLHLSNGLIERSSQSRVYTEAAYSFKGSEYLNTRWSVNIDDLAINEVFAESSVRAENSTTETKPLTGKYPVIVDAEVLAELFSGHVTQLSGANSYHSLPFVRPGEELIPDAKGDLLTLTLDPWLDFGADTCAASEQGIGQAPLKLVDSNKVVATAADKQYADYLKTQPTPSRGNIVLEPGSLGYEEMIRFAPQVIEILQFSGLFADPNSGTFSSEIRLAKLYDNQSGKVSFLKGGSLSGSITENFSDARLAKTRSKRAHFSSNSMTGRGYFGPTHALLNDVSIVG